MSRFRSYAQLMRLILLPSALGDITLGALATGSLPSRWPSFLLLLLASAALYTAGMVFNDWFDVEEDRRERPGRPIPSGRISRFEAGRLGLVLLTVGVLAATLAGWVGILRGETSGPGLQIGVAVSLVAAILLYDGWLKRTPLGPIAMGSCRSLNVLLGISLSGGLAWPVGPHLAAVVGFYIVGVTWFARNEAATSHRPALIGASVVILAALLLALPLPLSRPEGSTSLLFPYLLVLLGFLIGFPLHRAVFAPSPTHVQAAVRRCLMVLVALDATLATAVAGSAGLVILVLMAPSFLLARFRWLYAT